ncbi:flocculation protein FLO11-like, partial [Mizuhopecten yessoensis]|uniref:flocculation protein FLO11-like n=1 Tax=Mizuhopecten yessoensis TaxID=6573 RepID=UPI000B458D43
MDVSVLLFVMASLLWERLVLASDYFINNNDETWAETQLYCEQNNGKILILDSAEKWESFKLDPVYTVSQGNGNKYWVGHACGGCTNEMWCTGCPDNDCVELKGGELKRHPDCTHVHKAICEKVATTTTSSTTTSTSTTTTTTPVVTSTTSTTTAISPVVTTATSTTTTTLPVVTTATSTTTAISPFVTWAKSTTTNVSPVVTSMTSTTTAVASLGTSTTSNVAQTTTNVCCCFRPNSTKVLDDVELQEALQKLKSELLVKKNATSLYRRQFISVYESRASSVTIGSVSIVIMVVVGSLIVVPDIGKLVRFLCKDKKQVV